MSTIHRRDLLRQSSWAIAGLGLGMPRTVYASDTKELRFSQDLIRLTSNENPYGPSPLARMAMTEAIRRSNRYPWETTEKLLGKVGSRYGLSADHVLMGAGSTEILGLVTHYAALQKGTAVTADPTFSSWAPVAEKLGLSLVRVPLNGEKKLDLAAMLSAVSKETRLLYLCNPNNPTGTVQPTDMLRSVAEEASKKCIVLVDEAYLEYTDMPSLAPLVTANKNIVIAKTFSKIYGLAGARIGFALGHPDTLERVGGLQPWPNGSVSAVSAASAIASLDDLEFVRSSRNQNEQARNFTLQELKKLGFTVIPSSTNFIYYSVKNYAGNWQEHLREKKILVGGITERDGQWTRTTIGTAEEMRAFISAVKSFV
jgi:histidinol-phosphate aminotransferase